MEGQELIQTKTNKKYIKYILAILFGASFFSFEFVPNFSDNYYKAEAKAQEAKKMNAIALSKVKDYAKGTAIYNDYLKANKKKKEVFANYNNIVDKEKVFGFKSFHIFWERFVFTLMIFIYSIYNLFRSFYFERKNVGSKLMHFFVINFCMFYFFWIFQQFQDFSKLTYYLLTIISSAVIVFVVYFITKYQEHYINVLKRNYRDLAFFSILNTKKEKQKEVFELIEKNIDEKEKFSIE